MTPFPFGVTLRTFATIKGQCMDQIQQTVTRVIQGSHSFETKLACLAALESHVEHQYAIGHTNVLPIGLMTADDLVS